MFSPILHQSLTIRDCFDYASSIFKATTSFGKKGGTSVFVVGSSLCDMPSHKSREILVETQPTSNVRRSSMDPLDDRLALGRMWVFSLLLMMMQMAGV
jgi:hypothetical protein